MATFVFSPPWFQGFDALFEFVSLIIAFVISYYSYRLFRITEQKKYHIMAYGFFFLFLALFIKITTNLQIYFEIVSSLTASVPLTFFIYAAGYFLHRFLFLLGLLCLFNIAVDIPDRRANIIIAVLLFVATFFSHSVFLIFHFIAALFLIIIFWHFMHNYQKKKTPASEIVALSFFLLLLSQFFFLFIPVTNELYVLGEVSQFFGFLLLLLNHVVILKK
ncbi:hypothetical protein HZB03_03650 [Candidatus Woesearchaeota archaeon]|nr:hypothetical protein [Candidatus Woesearchaeota archaeon]